MSVRDLRRAALAAAIALSACGGASSKLMPQLVPIGGREVVVHGRTAIAGSTASIGMGDNFFTPTILAGPKGAAVTLTVRNRGEVLHNFSVEGQKFDEDARPGDELSVSVMLPAAGRLVFFCKYHRDESGMLGAIDVR